MEGEKVKLQTTTKNWMFVIMTQCLEYWSFGHLQPTDIVNPWQCYRAYSISMK
jgi:hypothetical protein